MEIHVFAAFPGSGNATLYAHITKQIADEGVLHGLQIDAMCRHIINA